MPAAALTLRIVPSEAQPTEESQSQDWEPARVAQLLAHIGPRLRRAVAGVLGAAHPDVDDATQLSLLGLVRALPQFRGECSIESYATRIAIRTAIHARRRARSRIDAPSEGEPGDLADPSTPDEAADVRERKGLIRDLLDAIPQEQAEALALRVMLGWSLEQISHATGVPMNTVRSRMRLAKIALRQRITHEPALRAALCE